MKAVYFEKFGKAADVLQVVEIDKPEPGEGEVLVRLHASAPNPSDVKKRMGSFPNLVDEGYVIPHSDGAGVIEAVGAGVSQARIGDRVWIYNAQFGRRFGTAAEYVSVPSTHAPKLAEEADFEIGACLGIPAMTAHRCVFADGPVEGQTILITGGAGRVGYYAIQWAANAGARVIATASNAEDKAACREAGAQIVINHRKEGWPDLLLEATGGKKVTRVIDVEFGANLEKVLDVIATGGVIATYSSTQDPTPSLPFFRMMYLDLTIRMVIVYAMPRAAKKAAIADIDAALKAGKLRHRIAETLPLDECARAHEIVEAGKVRGSVVLTI
ncbi:NADPH:quinone reductase [Breoghania sp.]|uniref:NADPH:quinone reductase n=1 Tax=Breoghania sp. TaxID=2065378 RepID=UPI0029C9B5DE|nr:NADPH:quinone reductase [Breoghania sp.]